MASKRQETVVYNLADRGERRRLMEHVNTLPPGLYDVAIKRRRPTRSLQQNSYYWAAIVSPWAQWLRREWGKSSITLEQAHEVLKRAVLGTDVLRNKAGEEIELTPTTHDMDVDEFSQYIDDCTVFVQKWADINPLPSDLFYEKGVS